MKSICGFCNVKFIVGKREKDIRSRDTLDHYQNCDVVKQFCRLMISQSDFDALAADPHTVRFDDNRCGWCTNGPFKDNRMLRIHYGKCQGARVALKVLKDDIAAQLERQSSDSGSSLDNFAADLNPDTISSGSSVSFRLSPFITNAIIYS